MDERLKRSSQKEEERNIKKLKDKKKQRSAVLKKKNYHAEHVLEDICVVGLVERLGGLRMVGHILNMVLYNRNII